MNKHRAYWSAMGVEPDPDGQMKKFHQKRQNHIKETLEKLIESSSKNFDDSCREVARVLREIWTKGSE